jgi:raffinose/stachyose/melibiose transport system substrate-binding protein
LHCAGDISTIQRERLLLRHPRFAVGLLGGAALALGVLAAPSAQARPGDAITLTMLSTPSAQPSFDVLIANFERAYPNIKVNASYAPQPVVYQLETTELAAGNAPDLLATFPGCGTPISTCVLAKGGYLAPLIRAPWTRWSLPSVISLSKYHQGLVAFLTSVGPVGVFTNDDLFRKLGLKVPQTFPQLLALCRRAKADGTVAFDFAGADETAFSWLVMPLAVADVYAENKRWQAELKAGNVTFEGTPGWHEALQQVIEMNDAGCFAPGASGTTQAGAIAEFAQGQGLMTIESSGQKGVIDAATPRFGYTFQPFPAGATAGTTPMYVGMGGGLSVNAHSSASDQAAAQTFIDFVARPAQDALYANIKGSLTQYQVLHDQVQPFMSASFVPLLAAHEYVMSPIQTWWNPNVGLTLYQDEVGLLTGQSSVDGILAAMDAAWQQGPA